MLNVLWCIVQAFKVYIFITTLVLYRCADHKPWLSKKYSLTGWKGGEYSPLLFLFGLWYPSWLMDASSEDKSWHLKQALMPFTECFNSVICCETMMQLCGWKSLNCLVQLKDITDHLSSRQPYACEKSQYRLAGQPCKSKSKLYEWYSQALLIQAFLWLK